MLVPTHFFSFPWQFICTYWYSWVKRGTLWVVTSHISNPNLWTYTVQSTYLTINPPTYFLNSNLTCKHWIRRATSRNVRLLIPISFIFICFIHLSPHTVREPDKILGANNGWGAHLEGVAIYHVPLCCVKMRIGTVPVHVPAIVKCAFQYWKYVKYYNYITCYHVIQFTSVCCICIRCKLVLVSTVDTQPQAVVDTFSVFLGHSRPRESLESCKTLVSHCYTVMVIQITQSDNVLKLTVVKFCSKPWWSNSGK